MFDFISLHFLFYAIRQRLTKIFTIINLYIDICSRLLTSVPHHTFCDTSAKKFPKKAYSRYLQASAG